MLPIKVASLSDNPVADSNTDLPTLPTAEFFGPTIVAASSAPGNRALHFVQNKVPLGLVWPQCWQAIVELIAFVILRGLFPFGLRGNADAMVWQMTRTRQDGIHFKNLRQIPACVFNFAALSVRSQPNSGSFRPK